MLRLFLLIGAVLALAGVADAQPRLVRVVIVMRHGVRPPTQPNAALAKFAAQPWPDWPVAPGELTPHGREGVRLMGATLRERLIADRMLPSKGCAASGAVSVWADGADQRTRKTGEILAAALEPGCALAAGSAPPAPRDPIFAGTDAGACKADPAVGRAALAASAVAVRAGKTRELEAATDRLQAILAPDACHGGAGTCLKTQDQTPGASPVPFPPTAALAEDLYLEYVDDKPMSDVGWGRASAADVDEVMRIHEIAFQTIWGDLYLDERRGAPMARLVLAALAGEPVTGGPTAGPGLKVLALAGHDSNLSWMGALFGLDWTLPEQPESTAPSTVLELELWEDHGQRYVRPVLFYETLDQMRTLRPGSARRLELRFKDCASGPEASCPLQTLRERALAQLPPGCGDMPATLPPAAHP